MPSRPLTPQQSADCARLKALYEEWLLTEETRTGVKPTQDDVTEQIGYSQSALSQRLTGTMAMNWKFAVKMSELIGRPVRDFSETLADEIAELLSLAKSQEAAESERTLSDNVVSLRQPLGKTARAQRVSIPQYATGGAMGGGLILKDQPGVIERWDVSLEWITKNVPPHTRRGNLCIVTGFGDSMKPLFNPGDPILVDRGVTTVEVDAVYFFRVDSEGFIKRLQRIPGQGILAISDNKKYRDWAITKDMNFEVFGKVLKVWRSEDF